MARVSTYLNFMGRTEEAFALYGRVFDAEPTQLVRMGDMPGAPVAEGERDLVANVQMTILGGHVLMGSDMVESMGHELRLGNSTSVHNELDTCADADRVWAGLADGATTSAPLQDMPWGAYWGMVVDRYGIQWMVSAPSGS